MTKVFIKAYEYAGTGQSIIQLSDFSSMALKVGMDDLEVVNITIGDKLLVTFDALPGIEVEGQVVSIMPNEQSGDRNFSVVLGFETSTDALKWGMSAEVQIPQK